VQPARLQVEITPTVRRITPFRFRHRFGSILVPPAIVVLITARILVAVLDRCIVVSGPRGVMSNAYSFLARIGGGPGVQPPERGANGGLTSDAL
jgi:hypothetical protein